MFYHKSKYEPKLNIIRNESKKFHSRLFILWSAYPPFVRWPLATEISVSLLAERDNAIQIYCFLSHVQTWSKVINTCNQLIVVFTTLLDEEALEQLFNYKVVMLYIHRRTRRCYVECFYYIRSEVVTSVLFSNVTYFDLFY